MLRVRVERQRRGGSLAKLCQLTGIDSTNLTRLERGVIPAGPSRRRRIAEAFQMPEEYLFQEVEQDAGNN